MTHKILKFQFGPKFRDSGSAFASSLSRPNSIARNRNRRLIGEPERHFASRRSFSSAAALFFSHPWSSSRVYVSPIARSTAFPRPIAPRSRPVVAHHLVLLIAEGADVGELDAKAARRLVGKQQPNVRDAVQVPRRRVLLDPLHVAAPCQPEGAPRQSNGASAPSIRRWS